MFDRLKTNLKSFIRIVIVNFLYNLIDDIYLSNFLLNRLQKL